MATEKSKNQALDTPSNGYEEKDVIAKQTKKQVMRDRKKT